MKTIKLILAMLAVVLTASSCLVDDNKDQSFAESALVIGFRKAVAAESYFADEGVVRANYPVNILGGQNGEATTEDITVTYEIDPASTATEGQEFDFVGELGKFTIPAGASFAQFPLDINTGGFDPDAPTLLTLKLKATDANGAVISSLSDQLDITFVGCQSSLDQSQYNLVVVRDDGVTRSRNEDVRMTSVNNFKTRTAGVRAPGFGGSDFGYIFNDICGVITIPAQGLVGVYSNEVKGSGTVDATTGNFETDYYIVYSGEKTFFNAKYTVQ